MLPKDRKKWLFQEEARLAKYQHQHRGLNFQKLLLPPGNDRKVNLVGRDNHIYKGSIPRVPLDQLPPEIDESSIDEEALYKEMREMNFPSVPEQEPLGPSRRIGGEYTLAKRMALAPVLVDCTEGLEEILILGKDGSIYKGKGKCPSKLELDRKLTGTKRPIKKVLRTSSTQEYVEPTLVLLHPNKESVSYEKGKKSLIELPAAGIWNVMSVIQEQRVKDEYNAADQSETTEHGSEDFQSEGDEPDGKSEESTEAEKFSEERGVHEDTGETSEEEGQEKLKSYKSTESDKSFGAKTAQESDTKPSEETDKGELSEADFSDVETSSGTDKLSSTEESNEIAEESDSK